MNNKPRESESATPAYMLFGRLAWIAIGPIFLVGSVFEIFSKKGELFSKFDIAYIFIVIFMIGGRFLEQKSGAGTTSTGEPSTWEHFKVYVIKTIIVVVIMWMVVKAIAMFLL